MPIIKPLVSESIWRSPIRRCTFNKLRLNINMGFPRINWTARHIDLPSFTCDHSPHPSLSSFLSIPVKYVLPHKRRNHADSHSSSATKNYDTVTPECPPLHSDVEWQVLSPGVQNPQKKCRADEGQNTNCITYSTKDCLQRQAPK